MGAPACARHPPVIETEGRMTATATKPARLWSFCDGIVVLGAAILYELVGPFGARLALARVGELGEDRGRG